MACVITYTEQTDAEDFYGAGADAKLLDFGEHSGEEAVAELFSSSGAVLPELLVSARDPK